MLKEFGGKKPRVGNNVYISETSEIIGDVEMGDNSSVWNGAVLRADTHYIRIGTNTSIQDNCVLHGTENKYPTVVGNNVSVGHNAIVHGCVIGSNCIIGMRSIILEGAEVGDWCIIGAGAVVTEGTKIPDGSIVLGVPGKVVGKVTEEHKKRITDNWKSYIDLKNRHAAEDDTYRS